MQLKKNLPEKVLEVIEMAIAAAWRRENGNRDQNVRAELNTQNLVMLKFLFNMKLLTAKKLIILITRFLLKMQKKLDANAEIGEIVEEKFG